MTRKRPRRHRRPVLHLGDGVLTHRKLVRHWSQPDIRASARVLAHERLKIASIRSHRLSGFGSATSHSWFNKRALVFSSRDVNRRLADSSQRSRPTTAFSDRLTVVSQSRNSSESHFPNNREAKESCRRVASLDEDSNVSFRSLSANNCFCFDVRLNAYRITNALGSLRAATRH